MKEIVKEQLEQRGLIHLYSDKQFNSYYQKLRGSNGSCNTMLMALRVLDLFICNG